MVLARGCVEACSDVHVGTQVGGVDLERGPDGALNAPADVQSETHVHFELGVSLSQSLLGFLKLEFRLFVYPSDDFDKTH